MSAFVICWLPFFVLAVVRPFLPMGAIPHALTSFFLWLGYANSFLNPVIYATLNKDFRTPFREILFFRCGSLQVRTKRHDHSLLLQSPLKQICTFSTLILAR
jgi:5-hydroxytryptamine receptor 7